MIKLVKTKRKDVIFPYLFYNKSDECYRMREIVGSRDQLRRGDKIKNDAFFRENSTFLRSLGSPAQVVVRFEGSQARQNGYLVFRRSNPELFPLSSARRARMPTIFRFRAALRGFRLGDKQILAVALETKSQVSLHMANTQLFRYQSKKLQMVHILSLIEKNQSI